MKDVLGELEKKRKSLGIAIPFEWREMAGVQEWFGNELTYSSNAIEGNTLTREETALVVGKGLTVEGKTIREHLEAVNHGRAYEWVLEQVRNGEEVSEEMMLQLHEIILRGINDEYAGRYRTGMVRIAGSRVVMPNAQKIPKLMQELVEWIEGDGGMSPVEREIEMHLRLVSIHPYVDGNGRVARLIMNLLLMQAGYPPAIVEKKERRSYLSALEKIQLGGGGGDYQALMYKAVGRSIEICLEAQGKKQNVQKLAKQHLLKIGELAKLTGETVPTIRHYTKEKLLEVAEYSPGGYQLYAQDNVERVRKIKDLQRSKRLTLAEIRKTIFS